MSKKALWNKQAVKRENNWAILAAIIKQNRGEMEATKGGLRRTVNAKRWMMMMSSLN